MRRQDRILDGKAKQATGGIHGVRRQFVDEAVKVGLGHPTTVPPRVVRHPDAVADHDAPPPRVPARTFDLSVGQVAEWLVWTRLVGSSSGDLHLFLPLRDEGIDGIVHRLSTDAYARVQVKGRHPRASRDEVTVDEVTVEVRDHELVDDRAVIVAVAIAVERPNLGLAPSALVVDVPTSCHAASSGCRSRRSPSVTGRTPR